MENTDPLSPNSPAFSKPFGNSDSTALIKVLAGFAIALITFFAGIIGYVSLNQAPPHAPVIQTTGK